MDKNLKKINELLKPYGVRVELVISPSDTIDPALFSLYPEKATEEFKFGVKQLADRRLRVYVWGVQNSCINSFEAFRQKIDTLADTLNEINEMDYLIPTKEQIMHRDAPLQIWQIPHDAPKKIRDLMFLPMDMVKKRVNVNDTLVRNNYKLIYTGKPRSSDTLEDIYYRFNMEIPLDFTGHSLSVSDVVVLNGKAFFVDSVGFVPLDNF